MTHLGTGEVAEAAPPRVPVAARLAVVVTGALLGWLAIMALTTRLGSVFIMATAVVAFATSRTITGFLWAGKENWTRPEPDVGPCAMTSAHVGGQHHRTVGRRR